MYTASILVTVIFVPLILGFLLRAARIAKPIKTADNGYLLQYATTIKVFAVIFILLLLSGLLFLLLKFPSSLNIKKDPLPVIFIIGMIITIALYFYIEFFTVKIWVGPAGIRGTSGWRGKREYTWQEIDEISYSSQFMMFKISSKNKTPIRVSALLSGLDMLRKFYTENLPQEKWHLAEKNLN